MKGVVAAGHPLTAEAGAEVLREGGNAVDAAIAAVLASFAVESPLTGFGAGGFMMVSRGEETVLIDFFVAAPGKDGLERGVELAPVPVHFDEETVQTFYVGPASCGVPGTAAGLELALRALRHAAAGRPDRRRREARPRGRAGQRRAGLHPGDPLADPRAPRRDARALRATGAPTERGRPLPLPGTRRGTGTLWRRRRRALLPRRGGSGAERLRRGARWHAGGRRPGAVRGD